MKKLLIIWLLLVPQLNFASTNRFWPRQIHANADHIFFFVGCGMCIIGSYAAASAGRELTINPNDDYLKSVQNLGVYTFLGGCSSIAYACHRIRKYEQMQTFEIFRANQLFLSFQAGEISRVEYRNQSLTIDIDSMLEVGELYAVSRDT